MTDQTSPAPAPKVRWWRRKPVIIAITALAALFVVNRLGIVQFRLPMSDSAALERIDTLEQELAEARGAAEQAAAAARTELQAAQTKIREQEGELARLRPIVQRYEGSYGSAQASTLLAELDTGLAPLRELSEGWKARERSLADLDTSLGPLAKALSDHLLARDFLEIWTKFQSEKTRVYETLAALEAHRTAVKDIADGNVSDIGQQRLKLDAARTALGEIGSFLTTYQGRLQAHSRQATELEGRAETLRTAWQKDNPGANLSGPTARAYVAEFNASPEGRAYADLLGVWTRNLERLVTENQLVRLPQGMTSDQVVRTPAFTRYIREFEKSYASTAARRQYLGHLQNGSWKASPTNVRLLQDPGFKNPGHHRWLRNSLGLEVASFQEAAWRTRMGQSQSHRFAPDTDFEMELAWFTENFVAMAIHPVGPDGQRALP